ncbi:hypothetical protein H9P43_003934 [Blastocladiella emersonii ATCC 22665]|nr:hypothetical protein H9P43_003934 [Blastocladiella emersonii ATCC 22665]
MYPTLLSVLAALVAAVLLLIPAAPAVAQSLFFTDPTPRNAITMSIAWPAPIERYDVHVYYLPTSYEQRAEAAALKEKIARLFPMFPMSPMHDRAIGPHPMPMFEVDVIEAKDFAVFVPWLALNHGSLSVLIHPQTPDHVANHDGYALWLGPRLPINLSMLRQLMEHEKRNGGQV